ncbi:DUF1684 domain-containing protein [Runella sp. CRIBMP]|uniref:DUF1684 domain-containing protein n=1 Tax=Runella sp. CRIBMP TaxID=2683261 RepID=UPI0014129E4A|nr:DUF1684 domain-containing protein [Runella sp. CRIBMP]NBB19999.1 DUF1684 domain-containing protein [Runella sp. CRIBMP]
MLKNKFLQLLIAIVIIGVIGYTFFGEETTVSDADYVAQLEKDRKEKDKFYQDSDTSPIGDKAAFKGLNYFAPNPAYKVVATIIPYHAQDKQVAVPMTDGSTTTYEKYGFAEFTLPDASKAAELNVYRLLIYKHEKGLSILFRDATAPQETYGGGRYLDFKTDDITDGKLTLDFNVAYNPYCAYNPTYACPIPPKENNLPVRVEAGEKIYEKHE